MSNVKEKKEELIFSADILVLEEISNAITQIADAFKRINQGPLKRRAIVVLLKDTIGSQYITNKQIEAVLDAAENLNQFISKPTK